MNIAFFGSPHIAATILEAVHKRFPVSLVVTQPDKQVGRKQTLTPTPVKLFSTRSAIHTVTNTSINRFIEVLRKKKIDLAVVVAYGEIISKELLDVPKFGFINVHYSLLPKYRGASPVQWALLNGDKETGVTIMQMDEELDHGPIIAQKTIPIETGLKPVSTIADTTASLLDKLTETACSCLINILHQVSKTRRLPPATPQNHESETYTRRLIKQDGFIPFTTIQKAVNNEQLSFSDLPQLQQEIFKSGLRLTIGDLSGGAISRSAGRFALHNFIRAMYPWPGAWTILPNGKRCKIISSRLISRSPEFDTRHPELDSGSKNETKEEQMLKPSFANYFGRAQQVQRDTLVITQIQIEGKQTTEDSNLINNLFR